MASSLPPCSGYAPLYHEGEVNHCPGCGQTQWFIGRISAECAFCSTAVPLQHTGLEGTGLGSVYWDRDVLRHGWHFGPQRHAPAGKPADWA